MKEGVGRTSLKVYGFKSTLLSLLQSPLSSLNTSNFNPISSPTFILSFFLARLRQLLSGNCYPVLCYAQQCIYNEPLLACYAEHSNPSHDRVLSTVVAVVDGRGYMLRLARTRQTSTDVACYRIPFQLKFLTMTPASQCCYCRLSINLFRLLRLRLLR